MPDRRAELLDGVANYILSNGLADLSLRPLATAIGTSPRMLLYFFGSKERLIAEALAHIQIREQIDFKRAVSKPRRSGSSGVSVARLEIVGLPSQGEILQAIF